MRLLSLEVASFRGFAKEQTFDLDADAIVVVGANGNGKTSLFDAVLWALSGRIPRLGNKDAALVCKFSDTGQARVVLSLSHEKGTPPFTITRTFDGKETRVSVDAEGETRRGQEAESYLIRRIWKEAADAASPAEALATVLTRSVYLQQDLVRHFIESATVQERFAAVSELVGAGRVTDLQTNLERAKLAWTKATGVKDAELKPDRARLSAMEARLSELKARPLPKEGALDSGAWEKWWRDLRTVGLKVAPVAMGSREAAVAIDDAIKRLDAERRASERRAQVLDMLGRDVGLMAGKATPELTVLREKIAVTKQKTEDLRRQVVEEQSRVAELRRLQANLKEQSEQLRALALLALKHLGDKCPVCEQDYDVDSTRQRLDLIAKGGATAQQPELFGHRGGPQSPVAPEKLPELLTNLSAQEKELSVAELDLRKAEEAAREYDAAEAAIVNRLADLGLKASTSAERLRVVRDAGESLQKHLRALTTAQKAGEMFAVLLSRAGEQATIQELEREVSAVRTKLQEEDKDLTQRNATGEQAQRVIEALRQAASSVVTKRIRELEPLLMNIYSRIDPHPAFRSVKFLASVVRGHGQLSTVVSDPLSEIECESPGVVLSSSQMNALAVCTFLALNLGVLRSPLDAAILDDPLQSLDDINLLGLIDLLRRTKDQRQLVVSTHDERFGNLLARKLRPSSPQQRTIVIELDGWSRAGPTVITRDVRSDPAPLRLVASS
jgi:DNA repair protein SbcC/Rad50